MKNLIVESLPGNLFEHVAEKAKSLRKEEYPNSEIYGIFIVNHDFTKFDLDKRNKTPFDKIRISDAIRRNMGLCSTLELLEGFNKLKNGKITMEYFDKKLHSPGLIQF